MRMSKKSICGLTAAEILSSTGSAGFELSDAVTIANSIYKRRTRSLSEIPKISKKLKKELEEKFISGIFDPICSVVSADKTVKFLFRTDSGLEFETVYLPENKRNTVCISTQSGCRMGCPFCVTAGYGFRGNLSAGEMVNQILSLPDAKKVTHIVFMGMGEPMDNLDNVLKACEIITSEWGLSVSPRNVTISTVGIIQGVEKFLSTSECNLTLSLYSPFTEERINMIPAEKLNPAKEIVELMKDYQGKKKRRFSIGYIMIEGVNDTDRHLEGLELLLRGSKIRVNLLPYHTVGSDPNRSSAEERMQFFKYNLVVSGISSSIRKSRGVDISAACGLLAKDLSIEK
jgi:23S rRNA (adenine2503-C2)-methyltransferase